ncbi:hypothetical protein BDY24DRAFT_373820 [Mrakia frigida]|uniref:uncharacterized protein n=1 Tax=Mrakia frigida TaxID=29902 RepID=UPI003FCBFB5D
MEIDPLSSHDASKDPSSPFLHAYGFLPEHLLAVLSRFLATRETSLPASFFDHQGVVSIGRGENEYKLDAWRMFDEGIKLGGWQTISHQLIARKLATQLSLPPVLPRVIHLPEYLRSSSSSDSSTLGPPPPAFPSRTSFSAEIVQALWIRYFAPLEAIVRIRKGVGDIRRSKDEEESRRRTVQEEWRRTLLARRAAEMRIKDEEMDGDVEQEEQEEELWEKSSGFLSESFVASKREADPISLVQLRALRPKPVTLPLSNLTSVLSIIDRKPFDTPLSEPRVFRASPDQPSSSSSATTTTPKQEPVSHSNLLLSPPQSTSPKETYEDSTKTTSHAQHRLSTPSPLRKSSAILVSQTPTSLNLIHTPPTPPSTTRRATSDPTPPAQIDVVASSIHPHLLFPRRPSRTPARPLKPSTARPNHSPVQASAVPAIQITHPTPTPSNSNNKRPADATLIAPSKKPRAVSFLLPKPTVEQEKISVGETAVDEGTESNLEGKKVVIGTDVRDEDVRTKLEAEVELLGGEISVRAVKEDWEDDENVEEKKKVVLLCWRNQGREEVEWAIKAGALLRTRLWISSLLHPNGSNLPFSTHRPREASLSGFESFKICITEYREPQYPIVVALIHLTGAAFSRTLTSSCTHLLCPPTVCASSSTTGTAPISESLKLTQAKKILLERPGSLRIVRDGKAWLLRCLEKGGDQVDVDAVEMIERAMAVAAAGGVGASGRMEEGERGREALGEVTGSLSEMVLG